MVLSRFTYISISTIPPSETSRQFALITSRSYERNIKEDVSGTLLVAGDLFAQTIEGPADAVARLVIDLYNDKRHVIRTVLEDQPITMRAFDRWSVGYSGSSLYIENLMDSCGRDSGSGRVSNASLMLQFLNEMSRQKA